MNLDDIEDFVKRVNARAERAIVKGMVSGAHYNAMREELALLRASEQRPDGGTVHVSAVMFRELQRKARELADGLESLE